ncbi:MAG: alpha-glucosidase/alpha-galactosidase, partial [Promethearchaeota archaeon]
TTSIFRAHVNVPNTDSAFITNLPDGCTVEVPTYIDAGGIHPQGGIRLPTACQALCMSNIMVQKATVEGFIEKSREKIYHAVLLDPNTASVCSPEEIREMVDKLFKAQKKWIKGF